MNSRAAPYNGWANDLLCFWDLKCAGFAVLFPVLPLVVTNFFAQRRSGGEFIDCATFEPHHEPPACQVRIMIPRHRTAAASRRHQRRGSIRSGSNKPSSDSSQCRLSPFLVLWPMMQNAHSDSVMWSSYTSFVSQAVVGFLLAPCIGRWSDQYGRKPFLVVGPSRRLLMRRPCRRRGCAAARDAPDSPFPSSFSPSPDNLCHLRHHAGHHR